MNNNLLNALYLEHDAKFGVLSNSNEEKVKHIIGTDLTLVERKEMGKSFLLVPLTANHKFEIHENWLKVDGERINSDNFWRQDGCQWIEI